MSAAGPGNDMTGCQRQGTDRMGSDWFSGLDGRGRDVNGNARTGNDMMSAAGIGADWFIGLDRP
jgi:hypothetical protein